MKRWLCILLAALLLAPLAAFGETALLVISTERSVQGVMLMDEKDEVVSSTISQAENNDGIDWTLRVTDNGSQQATLYTRDANGNWLRTDRPIKCPPSSATPRQRLSRRLRQRRRGPKPPMTESLFPSIHCLRTSATSPAAAPAEAIMGRAHTRPIRFPAFRRSLSRTAMCWLIWTIQRSEEGGFISRRRFSRGSGAFPR